MRPVSEILATCNPNNGKSVWLINSLTSSEKNERTKGRKMEWKGLVRGKMKLRNTHRKLGWRQEHKSLVGTRQC